MVTLVYNPLYAHTCLSLQIEYHVVTVSDENVTIALKAPELIEKLEKM